MNFLYLFGGPGSGKSTLARALLAGAHTERARGLLPELHHETAAGVVIELGDERDPFRGTDVLAMNAIGKAIATVAARPSPLLFAEGDRLACDRFFDAILDAGYTLTLAYLNPPLSVVDARLRARAESTGKAQAASWVAGRRSKCAKLAATWEPQFVLDGPDTAAHLAALAAGRAADDLVLDAFLEKSSQ